MRSAVCSLLVVCLGLLQGDAQEQTPPKDQKAHPQLSVWMEVKVKESQKIFVALARADFDAMAESTHKLKTLSGLEGFVRRSAPGYMTQLQAFEFAVDDIQRNAKLKNIEGATLGFNQLTLSCVNCHKQIRKR